MSLYATVIFPFSRLAISVLLVFTIATLLQALAILVQMEFIRLRKAVSSDFEPIAPVSIPLLTQANSWIILDMSQICGFLCTSLTRYWIIASPFQVSRSWPVGGKHRRWPADRSWLRLKYLISPCCIVRCIYAWVKSMFLDAYVYTIVLSAYN